MKLSDLLRKERVISGILSASVLIIKRKRNKRIAIRLMCLYLKRQAINIESDARLILIVDGAMEYDCQADITLM